MTEITDFHLHYDLYSQVNIREREGQRYKNIERRIRIDAHLAESAHADVVMEHAAHQAGEIPGTQLQWHPTTDEV